MHIEPIKKTVGGHTGEAVYVQLHIRLSHFERFPLFGRVQKQQPKRKKYGLCTSYAYYICSPRLWRGRI